MQPDASRYLLPPWLPPTLSLSPALVAACSFFCQQGYIFLYLSILAVLLGVAMVMASQPGYQSTEWDAARNTIFTCCVAFGLVPCIHWVGDR